MHTTFLRLTRPLAVFAAVAALLPHDRLRAQGDPAREIKEIAESIDEQLREIDRLLLESGKKDQARAVPKDLLQQAHERSQTAEDGIDKLIEKLNEMKNRGGGSGSGDSQQQQQNGQQPQDGQQQGQPQPGQGQPGARRENQTPDFVQQPQPGQQQQGQEGQQQQPEPGQPQPQPGGQPLGGQETPTGGENRPGNNPPQPETGPGQPGTGEGSWGELQPYLNFLRNRGATPKVPEKYRKYYEAYLKNKAGGGQ